MRQKERIKYFDNIKGLLIILVVFSHFLYEFQDNILLNNILKSIYFFHMPIFIFVSGYFSKNSSKNNLLKLLFYYIVGNTILMWFSFLMYKTPFSLIEPYYSYWYLIALIFYRKFISYVKDIKFILPISIFVAFIVGYFNEINNVLALSRIICFFPFFLLGYKLDRKYVDYFLKKRNNTIYILGYLFVFILILLITKCISFISVNDTMMLPYVSSSGIISRTIIFTLAFFMLICLLLIVPNKKIPFITLWGKNSLYIYIYHRIIILILIEFINSNFNTWSYLIIFSILTFIICLIFGSDKISVVTNGFYEKVKITLRDKNVSTRKVLLIEFIILIIAFTLFVASVSIVINDFDEKKNISNKRIEEAYKIETSDSDVKLDFKKKRLNKKVLKLKLNDSEKSSSLYQVIDKSSIVCFIGDSITAGSRNGGYGWFLPLINNFEGKKVINISKGGATVKTITKRYNGEIANLYIIAIGTNDIRYKNSVNCSMDEDEYIKDISKLIEKIPNRNTASFVFIAPWFSLDTDPFMKDNDDKKDSLNKYRKSLEKFCDRNDYLYIDPNGKIEEEVLKNPDKYLTDYIHPNKEEGIYLYSRAVIDFSS